MKRSERIKDKIPIVRVLSDYGYDVYEGGGEQQFRCDLHGDGSDNAPSARVYPESNSFFCFACGKARDSIALVMEKEGSDFNKSCTLLEKKYGLPVWEYKKKKDPFESDQPNLPDNRNILEKRVGNRLYMLTRERAVEYDLILKLWEGYDLLCSLEHQSDSHWRKLVNQIPSQRNEDER